MSSFSAPLRHYLGEVQFGHLPIEIAAYENRRKDVEILFLKDPMYKMKPDDIKSEGNKAYKGKDYLTAVKLYSMAANLCPDDTTLYSNRCLCWLKMGEGERAMVDSGICRVQRPGWAKACYLHGAAQMLLKGGHQMLEGISRHQLLELSFVKRTTCPEITYSVLDHGWPHRMVPCPRIICLDDGYELFV
ncbi:hypothetical protein U9M48_023414 [Paspalum notatum var. saurae]|uniref:Uncharacterized protein n=1 Tax=Paspalum notatum var. saurae TaxID=547442 RepID=A0AAQ3TNX9_PASNO